MVPLIWIALLVASVYGQDQNLDEPDILSAHGGVFRHLDWTNEELAAISALHTTASHHKLMELVARKLATSDIDDASRRRIEKFMMQKRPPKFLESFLSDSDRDYLLEHHAAGDFHQYAVLLFQRLFELPKSQAVAALHYFGHRAEAEALADAECYECAVQRLAERLAR
ncbi:unnamed protein product [Nippostrongylus brasiliensis]|uniref:Conserved secreted protein n=1 Tax=Nippostrongylus brasiliensis TaxID=27835 RepID=A0A0N4Y6N6_NIPBR|nr:hypothetical protein Q1695_010063 [Nippostrongylus brasiliensis]VDL75348.1 unnamed protein product [Nippostrongylus brasiliensis]